MNELYSLLVLHLIESTDWAVLFLLMVFLLRIKSARVKSWLYRISLLKFLIPTTLFASWLTLDRSGDMLSAFIVTAEPVISVVEYTTEKSFFNIPFYLWLIGIDALIIVTLFRGIRYHQRIQKASTPFDGHHEALLQQTLSNMDTGGRTLKGMIVESGPSIALYGIFRPRIIAKRAFLDTLTDDELVSAYQHEISHWIRRDNLWRLLTDAVTALFWFHPLVWFIRNRLTLETEKACDETVLGLGKRADRYANCLLKAAEFSHEENQFGAIALSETSLKQRVSHVIQYKRESLSIMKTTAIILTCLSLFGWSMVAFAHDSGLGTGAEIYNISDLDTPPSPIARKAPIYPPDLKKEKVTGVVNIEMIVDENGNIISITVLTSSHPDFTKAALVALPEWKFKPGIKDGEAVKTLVRLPLSFALRNAPHPENPLRPRPEGVPLDTGDHSKE